MNGGTSFRNMLPLLQLALFPVVIQGQELVLGEAGGMAELPCKSPQEKSIHFSWKDSSGTTILGTQSSNSAPVFLVTGSSKLKDRVESKKLLWDQGSFPLIIKNLDMEDSGTYHCELEGRTTKVQLMVFKLNPNLGNKSPICLLPGESLTMTLESPSGSDPLVEWKDPGNITHKKGKSFSLSQRELQKSGTWTCTVSKDGKTLVFSRNIKMLAFKKVSDTVYAKEGEQVEFSLGLTCENINLKGELKWQKEGTSSPKRCANFSLENKKVSVKVQQDCKFQMKETLPFYISLPQASHQDAGSGNLTLLLSKGQLHQEVKLVMIRMNKSQNHLTCEVLGPLSRNLMLRLKLEDQDVKFSNQQKKVEMQDPDSGTWQCLLSDKDKVLLESKVEVLPTVFTWASPKLLASVLGGIAGFLIFTGFCIFCCVKCWHRRRQAERMSQIKRLLSEKKTCQCPHRFQKTCSLI